MYVCMYIYIYIYICIYIYIYIHTHINSLCEDRRDRVMLRAFDGLLATPLLMYIYI